MAKLGVTFEFFELILILGPVISVLGGQCDPPPRSMYAAENRALQGFAYLQRPVASRVICARDCNMDERCKSFSFNDCNKMCELNHATRGKHPGNFSEIQGSVYSDEDADTPRYSLNDTNGCMILHNGKSLQ